MSETTNISMFSAPELTYYYIFAFTDIKTLFGFIRGIAVNWQFLVIFVSQV